MELSCVSLGPAGACPCCRYRWRCWRSQRCRTSADGSGAGVDETREHDPKHRPTRWKKPTYHCTAPNKMEQSQQQQCWSRWSCCVTDRLRTTRNTTRETHWTIKPNKTKRKLAHCSWRDETVHAQQWGSNNTKNAQEQDPRKEQEKEFSSLLRHFCRCQLLQDRRNPPSNSTPFYDKNYCLFSEVSSIQETWWKLHFSIDELASAKPFSPSMVRKHRAFWTLSTVWKRVVVSFARGASYVLKKANTVSLVSPVR